MLGFAVQLVPRRVKKPKWLRTFVEEIPEKDDELLPRPRRRFTLPSVTLLYISLAGFLLQMATVVYPRFRLDMVYPTASWAVSVVLIAILRPTTAPKSLLVLYISILVSQLVIVLHELWNITRNEALDVFAILSAWAAIIAVLQMPLRDPNLPHEAISPAFGPATSHLRSPEDNLTLWQFMTVSWMAPLISLGTSRQLNDEDVWQLGYQFQHKTLHEKFRELKGSVLKRLLEANGIDLLIVSILGIIEQLASMHSFTLF